jgi:hypothetical protein
MFGLAVTRLCLATPMVKNGSTKLGTLDLTLVLIRAVPPLHFGDTPNLKVV